MAIELKSFEAAITAADFSSEDYCGTHYAAKMLGLSVSDVQMLVEKGEIDAWKTLGGYRRVALRSINCYLTKNKSALSQVNTNPKYRLRVLIVEDDENTQELYQSLFASWDLALDCTWMSSAVQALMDTASIRPDLLITDLQMPGVDGIEMLKALTRNKHLAKMQILVITGVKNDVIEARGGIPGYAHVVQKPINFDWLQGYLLALLKANSQWRN